MDGTDRMDGTAGSRSEYGIHGTHRTYGTHWNNRICGSNRSYRVSVFLILVSIFLFLSSLSSVFVPAAPFSLPPKTTTIFAASIIGITR